MWQTHLAKRWVIPILPRGVNEASLTWCDVCGRCTELLGELEAAQVSSSQSQQQLQEARQDHRSNHLQWETDKSQLQVPCLKLSHTCSCSVTQTGTMPAEPSVSRREVVTTLLFVLV